MKYFLICHGVGRYLWGSITVQLNYCLFCLDSAALHTYIEWKQFYLWGQNQTSKRGGQLYWKMAQFSTKIDTAVITWNVTFLKSLKSDEIFGKLLKKNLSQRTFKIWPIWSQGPYCWVRYSWYLELKSQIIWTKIIDY